MPLVFSQPVQFSEAAQRLQIQSLLPTDLSSEELSQISSDILERALFSARTTYASYLDQVDQTLKQYVDGTIDLATARLALSDKLDSLGYSPADGTAGSIVDLSSDERINLVLDTNAQMAYGYGSWMQGQDAAILDQWPAQELYRAAPAKQPRDWEDRWSNAGGSIYDGRMIALKNDAIWTAISAFGLPYPPFDFGSHMDVRDVDRDTAVSLGLIDETTQIQPQTRDFNQDLQVSGEIRSTALRQAIMELGYQFDQNGALTLG